MILYILLNLLPSCFAAHSNSLDSYESTIVTFTSHYPGTSSTLQVFDQESYKFSKSHTATLQSELNRLGYPFCKVKVAKLLPTTESYISCSQPIPFNSIQATCWTDPFISNWDFCSLKPSSFTNRTHNVISRFKFHSKFPCKKPQTWEMVKKPDLYTYQRLDSFLESLSDLQYDCKPTKEGFGFECSHFIPYDTIQGQCFDTELRTDPGVCEVTGFSKSHRWDGRCI